MIKKLFEEQKNDEEVLLVFRRHWLALLPSILSSGVLFMVGIFGLFLPFFVKITGESYNLYLLLESLIFIFAIVLFYISWVINHLSIGILTTQRLVDVDQHNLFWRNTAAALLKNVQDISVDVTGFLPTLFGVGAIHVMTAGEVPNVEYTYILHTESVVEKIHEAQDKLRKENETIR